MLRNDIFIIIFNDVFIIIFTTLKSLIDMYYYDINTFSLQYKSPTFVPKYLFLLIFQTFLTIICEVM